MYIVRAKGFSIMVNDTMTAMLHYNALNSYGDNPTMEYKEVVTNDDMPGKENNSPELTITRIRYASAPTEMM